MGGPSSGVARGGVVAASARANLARRAAALAPLAVVGAVLLVSARVFYVGRHYTSLAGFAELGATFARHLGLQALAGSPIGYDGQFAYYVARQPSIVFTCATNTATCPLDLPSLRAQRILYPLLARLVALGQPSWIPFALLLVNFVAVLAVAALVSAICVELGATRWWGAAAGLFTGEVLAFARDLNDPLGVLWAVLALYLLRKQRPLWAAAAAGAALLTREQLILFVPLLALPLLAERRWRTLALAAAITLLPFVVWQIVLHAVYHQWAFFASTDSAALMPLPFAGLWQQRFNPEFAAVVATAALPVALEIVAGALALRQVGARGMFADPVPLLALSYGLISSLMSAVLWINVWAPARLAAPGVIFGIFALCRLKPPLRRPLGLVYALALVSAAAVLTMVACLQLV
jgi:hypothetical protein